MILALVIVFGLWGISGCLVAELYSNNIPFRKDVTLAEILLYLPIYITVGPFFLLGKLIVLTGLIKILSWQPFNRK